MNSVENRYDTIIGTDRASTRPSAVIKLSPLHHREGTLVQYIFAHAQVDMEGNFAGERSNT